MDQNKDKDNSKHEHDEERSAEDRPAGSKVRRILVPIWLR
jgi:hypothetical protein